MVTLAAVLGAALLVSGGAHHSVYRAFLYPVVTGRVTQGAATRDEAIKRVFDFVYLNVRSPTGMRKVDDSAADSLVRGFGYCDPSAMAFVRLVEELGVPGRLLFLYDEDGSSPHTVAEAFLDGEWRVFDTLYGFIPRREDGQVATARDLAERPDLLGPSRVDLVLYANARPVTQRPPSETRTVAGSALRAVVSAAPDWLVDAAQEVYLRLPEREYKVAGFLEEGAAPDKQLFLRARHYQVFRRSAAAADAYREFARRFPESPYTDDAQYSLALLEFSQQANPAGAAALLQRLVDGTPTSAWRADATYLLARAREGTGDCAAAQALYRVVAAGKSNGREDAQTRLPRLGCA